MKTDYTSNLRYNEKIKETQTFMTIDGLMKKIRKKFQYKEGEYVDAQMKLRQIMCFWKQNWEYQHFHPIFLNPSVYYPIVLMDFQNNTSNPKMKQFIAFVRQFIQRMRIGQQNQINYKIEQMQYQRHFSSTKQDEIKLISISQKSVESSLKIMYEVTKNMIKDLRKSNQKIRSTEQYEDQIGEQEIKYSQNSQIQLKYIMLTLQQHYQNQFGNIHNQMMDQDQQGKIEVKPYEDKDYKRQTEELIIFTANIMKILQKMKIQERHYGSQKTCGSSFISVQPQIGELTYILHPLIFAINSHFNKQKFQKQFDKQQYNNKYLDPKQEKSEAKKCKRWQQVQIDWKHLANIKDNLKHEDQKHSKIVFLNLDGYESQYNIEFAKNFNKNLMYISFPNFGQSHEQSHACRQNRFYKKIMFNQTQRTNQKFSNQILQQMAELQYLCQNPQNYHENAEKFYQPRTQFHDNTQNIFIFPMQMQILKQKHRQQATKDISIESYQSFFIRYMMKNHMNHLIRSFNPSHIIISYSNSINIEQPHFIEMMQELTKISKYKLMLFPNFTTSYVSDIQLNVQAVDQNNETDYAYSYAVSDSRLLLPVQRQQFHNENDRCFDNCCYTLAFLNKLAVFLKVSSGTYNLQNVYQRETSLSKYKNVKVFPHVQFLFEVLGKEYTKLKDKVDKTMLNATSSIILNAKKQCQKDLDKCVPIFYKQLFKVLKSLIFNQQDKKMLQQKQIIPRQIREQYQNQILKTHQEHSNESIQKLFQEFIDCQIMQRSDNKFQYNAHIYIKTRQQKIQYRQIQKQNEEMKNISGIHRVSFQLKKSESLPIYKDTSVVYQVRQIGKKQCFVLLMNHLSKQQKEVVHYIGKIPISQSKLFKEQIQKCVVLPIQFHGSDTGNKFKVKCEWNYAQTAQNLILYWPSQYDFIRASLFKFNQQKYEARITNQIYVASVNNYTKFYKVQHNNQQIIPRKGCSYYNLEDRLFIFGGSYERQFNYLNLQHDITVMELAQTKQISQQTQVRLVNLKQHLYSPLIFKETVNRLAQLQPNQQTMPNSFVRTKFQMEFFELQQLRDLKESENVQLNNGTKTVIMFGGYGQNFINPHSLLTYFYYQLKFSLANRQLLSIKKKNIFQKVVPINVKNFIKNKNIFQQSNIFDDGNSALKSDYVNENYYFYHRVVYRMTQDQLQYKIKNLYAYQLFTNNQKSYELFAQKIGEKRYTQEVDELKFEISKDYKNHLHVFKQDRNYVFSINYDLRTLQMNTGLQNPYVKLTNKAIISIDYHSNFIYALIKHDKYTKDKCVLAYQKIVLPGKQALDRDSSLEIYLKQLKTFDQKFEIHALLISRRDEIALIHGSCFQGFQVKDYIFKLKKQKTQLFEQKTVSIQPKIISLKEYYNCTSFIYKKDHYIFSLNFMTFNQKKLNNVFAMDEYALNLAQKNISWQQTKPLVYFMLIFVEKGQEKIIKKQSLKFVEMKRSQYTFCMIQSKDLINIKKRIVFKTEDNFKQFMIIKDENGKQYKVFKVYLLQADRDWDAMSSCSRIQKNQSIYEDNDIPIKC